MNVGGRRRVPDFRRKSGGGRTGSSRMSPTFVESPKTWRQIDAPVAADGGTGKSALAGTPMRRLLVDGIAGDLRLEVGDD
jgi:hypothetical protein